LADDPLIGTLDFSTEESPDAKPADQNRENTLLRVMSNMSQADVKMLRLTTPE
jgi:hypothetical protein